MYGHDDENISSPQSGTLSELQASPPATVELPDDLRIPLHELQADAGYLVGRVAADGAMSGLVLQTLETKLSHVAEAAYRLNGSRQDLLEALKELSEAREGDDLLGHVRDVALTAIRKALPQEASAERKRSEPESSEQGL